MATAATPRILPAHLTRFLQKVVMMLGTISSMHGDNAQLTSSNNEEVTLILNRDSHLSLNSVYQVVGKVVNLENGQGIGIRVLGATEWPRNENGQLPDLKAFEAVVGVTHQYKEIFYEGEGSMNGDGVVY